MLQERGLAGARAPGHENVLARVLDEAEELLLLGGEGGMLTGSMLAIRKGFLDWSCGRGGG
jgi:hypothetical protein